MYIISPVTLTHLDDEDNAQQAYEHALKMDEWVVLYA